MIPFLVLIMLIIVYIAKLSKNSDLIKEHSKNETDKANVKNARQFFHFNKVSIIIVIICILLLIVFLLSHFTSIDAAIIDYFSYDIYKEEKFDTTLYYIPIYLYLFRNIYIEVEVSEFLLKYFKTKEEELDTTELKQNIKSIFYKKKPSNTNISTNSNQTKTNSISQQDEKITQPNQIEKQNITNQKS